jgi:hypothetical protein
MGAHAIMLCTGRSRWCAATNTRSASNVQAVPARHIPPMGLHFEGIGTAAECGALRLLPPAPASASCSCKCCCSHAAPPAVPLHAHWQPSLLLSLTQAGVPAWHASTAHKVIAEQACSARPVLFTISVPGRVVPAGDALHGTDGCR